MSSYFLDRFRIRMVPRPQPGSKGVYMRMRIILIGGGTPPAGAGMSLILICGASWIPCGPCSPREAMTLQMYLHFSLSLSLTERADSQLESAAIRLETSSGFYDGVSTF